MGAQQEAATSFVALSLRPAASDVSAHIPADTVARFDRITTMARRLLGVDSAAIDLVEQGRIRPLSQSHEPSHAIERSRPIADLLLAQPGVVAIADTLLDPRTSDDAGLLGLRIRSLAGHPLLGPGGDRLGTLCVAGSAPRPFSPADLESLQDLARWAEEELALAQEFARSAQVQRSMLPAALVSFPGWDVAGRCSPVRPVGGDFYDWYPVRGGVAITLADVMGKGMPAALIAANVRAVMRSMSPMNGVAAAVESAAETLETDLDGAGVFVTLFHAHVHEQSGLVRYIDAGHGLTVLVRGDGTSERLPSTGLPLGAGWGNSWDEGTVRMRPGDALVSVSDGVLDAFDGTLDSLRAVEALIRDAHDSAGIVRAIADAVAGRAPDDVSVLALRRVEVPRLDPA